MKQMGRLINNWNQLLAFSPVYAASYPAESVFWPGCSAMKLEPALLELTYGALREEIPGLGFSSWCCGKPTLALGSAEQKQRRSAQLGDYFRAGGIRRVYTLCPNCRRTLGKRDDIEVVSAWPMLARYVERHPLQADAFRERFILHDPCASRDDDAAQRAAREILTRRGVDFVEFEHHGAGTRCCGRINMLFLTDPPAAERMLTDRLGESGGLPIVTYCESCTETFRAQSHPATHLLEVLFNRPASRSILNRLNNAHRRIRHD